MTKPPTSPADRDALTVQHLDRLGELADLGMQLARQIVATPSDHDDPALAFDRVSRAVRLTLMLQDKLAREPTPPVDQQKARVHRIVSRIAEREHRGAYVLRQISERLDQDFCGDILDQPISIIVAIICKDLGLSPDWKRLAQEAWAQEEIASSTVGWPLTMPPPTPAHPGGGRDPDHKARPLRQSSA